MNDLRLLQQIDPNKKIISLEFKQINSLEPMLPLLIKFEDLESLSLHGNRLKNLPKDMSELKNLAELDISNNLFIDINDLAESLKSLPGLTHLIMNFKSHQEENFIRNSLPRLERVNKKPVMSHKSEFTFTQRKKNEVQRLNEGDLESIGILYDEIREIHRSEKHFVDKELADDFDRNVENIMSELSHRIKGNESEVEKNCSIICGKYALIDLCFIKLITFFYHFDKKKASVFEKIHDEIANMFKSITDLVQSEALRAKIEISEVKTQKEDLYKAEIKRLKGYQTESNRQIEYLEEKNKELIERLMKLGKSNVLENALGKNTFVNRSPTKLSSKSEVGGSLLKDANRDKENNTLITVKNKPKNLTLNQLKEIMNEIYESKIKFNTFCLENSQPIETLETHMYTYLNQKYGLKSIAVEWAMSIVNGIKKFGLDDCEVGTFGKILRNQVEEEFYFKLKKYKEFFIENYRKFKKNFSQNESTEISINESEEILLFMNLKREKINLILGRLREDKLINNVLTLDKLEKGILEYCVKRHDEKIFELHKEFKAVDEDEDGIINIEQLERMMKVINPNVDIEMLVKLVDPSGKGIIVFSYMCEVLLKDEEFKEFFKIDAE